MMSLREASLPVTAEVHEVPTVGNRNYQAIELHSL